MGTEGGGVGMMMIQMAGISREGEGGIGVGDLGDGLKGVQGLDSWGCRVWNRGSRPPPSVPLQPHQPLA